MDRAPVIAGFDQGFNLTGWCVGDGATVPTAGAWRFPDLRDEYGELGGLYLMALRRLHERFRFSHAIFEAPFIDRFRDKTVNLRKRFGIDMVLQAWCRDNGIVVDEEPFGRLKRRLTGHAGATKDEMVAAALAMGITLPKTKADGREDAADGFAAWLIGVDKYASHHAPTFIGQPLASR